MALIGRPALEVECHNLQFLARMTTVRTTQSHQAPNCDSIDGLPNALVKVPRLTA